MTRKRFIPRGWRRYIPRWATVLNGHSPTGEELKAEGMARAAAARKVWFTLSQHTLYNLPTGRRTDSEWLTDRIGLPRKVIGKDQNNAVGSAINAAARKGWIVKVDARNSTRPSSHGAEIKVWERTAKR